MHSQNQHLCNCLATVHIGQINSILDKGSSCHGLTVDGLHIEDKRLNPDDAVVYAADML